MSRPLRIGLVAEGITDYEFLFAAITRMLEGRPFILTLLQPEGSVAFSQGAAGHAGALGGGWRGVYKWCQLATSRNGNLRDDTVFFVYDLIILHLDADVANEDPANDNICPLHALSGILPCAVPCVSHAEGSFCPKAKETADNLRRVLLLWVNETSIPPRTILCTPSKNMEAWVVYALFPDDAVMNRKGWECYPTPETRLSQQPKGKRISKSRTSYSGRREIFGRQWPILSETLYEAMRFHQDFKALVDTLGS